MLSPDPVFIVGSVHTLIGASGARLIASPGIGEDEATAIAIELA
jgi:hypothetical protein